MHAIEHQAPHRPIEPVVEGARTLGEVLAERARATPDAVASYQKKGDTWQPMSWGQFYDRSRRVAARLVAMGLDVGDRVAIFGPTREEWGIYDLGGQLAGLVTVGVYPKQSPDQIRYLLEHSGSRVAFVADDGEMETVMAASEGLDAPPVIVPWNDELHGRWRERGGDRMLAPGELAGDPLGEAEERARQDAVDPSAAAILVYTSGTTGPPKGAMISHDNILALLRNQANVIQFYQDDLMISFLPMAHVTERVLAFHSRINTGVPAAYASSVGAVLQELAEVRPTVFGSVPRLFEKLYAKVQGEVERASGLKQSIFRWGESVARRRIRLVLEGRPVPALLGLQFRLARSVVFEKIHQGLGGRIRVCITGAAPISREILEFLWAIELPVLEAYGMTEATVVTHINRLDSPRLGTVGKVIEPMECRIAADGEILLRGPMVFKGYFKNPEATAETVVDDWLHSGDIGEIDADGYLRITDRKKHLIITAGGKNVAPANIERAVKNQSPLISQVHAHGDRRPYVCALVAPSPLETLEWGQAHGLLDAAEVEARKSELLADPSARSEALGRSMAAVVEDRRFQELFRGAVQRGNEALSRVERVRRYFVLDRDFSQEGGELTPTMKMKRKAIEEKYADQFDRVYDDPDFAIEAEAAG
ncbi:MAG: long-chain fatty acid--CoA ligase [Acidobacteriota bacterium]